jgi:hypothetical protein
MLFATACIAAAASLHAQTQGQVSDKVSDQTSDLRVYGVNVIKKAPLKDEFTGYGIYLGQGKVITAAHIIGHWPALANLRVRVGNLELPAEAVKIDREEALDLALLSVDETQLPMGLRLRRNPLCKASPPFGTRAAVVYPDRIVETRTISPIFIAPKYRARMSSLIAEQQGSGAGVFLPDYHCLLGIISMKVQKYAYRRQHGRLLASPSGWAGYYVPVSAIAAFLPKDFRY